MCEYCGFREFFGDNLDGVADSDAEVVLEGGAEGGDGFEEEF